MKIKYFMFFILNQFISFTVKSLNESLYRFNIFQKNIKNNSFCFMSFNFLQLLSIFFNNLTFSALKIFDFENIFDINKNLVEIF